MTGPVISAPPSAPAARRTPGRQWLPGRHWLPAPHWPSVAGRARADAGPLALVAVVVTVVALLASAVPPQLRATSDAAVRDTVSRAASSASSTSRAATRSTSA